VIHRRLGWKIKTIMAAPFLCLITPVFDPGQDSLCKLIGALKAQTHREFLHVMISNGPSPKIRELVSTLNLEDSRFVYDEIAEESIQDSIKLLVNLGKRREHCLKKYDAERYLFLDMDIKLLDNDYFLKLYRAHNEIRRDVLITLIKIYQQGNEIILPVFPIEFGRIDIGNYCFTKKIARTFSYPTDYIGIANDYRYFTMISNEHNTAMLNFVAALRDGNSTYKRFTSVFEEGQKASHSRGISWRNRIPSRLRILLRHARSAWRELRNYEN
jgi:hypothetical protein